MSREVEELEEFNDRVNSAPEPEHQNRRGDIIQEAPVAESTRDETVGNVEMWAVYGGRNYSPCEQAVKNLPPGQYTVEMSNSIGLHFHSVDVNLDELIDMPDSATTSIINEIKQFWTKEEHFRKFGFLWKRGVLLWGPPGSGKTSVLQMLSKEIIKREGISIYVNDPNLTARGLSLLRHVEKKRPLVIMLEDIDAIINEYGEGALLALMDGELQIDNVVFVATTNYPERLDKRFINRPSRFDIVKKVGMPSSAARETYLTIKNPRLREKDNRHELKRWIESTEGFSVAHLKELIVSVEVFGVSFDQAIARLVKMSNVEISSTDREKFGFM